MTKRSTKSALLSAVVALLLCCSMLVGTTFAWFTDSVTSANNIIKSGNLDVTMEWKDATASGAQQSYKDAAEGAIFNYPNGEEIDIIVDRMSLKKKDLVEVFGRQFVGIGVVGPKSFAKVVK